MSRSRSEAGGEKRGGLTLIRFLETLLLGSDLCILVRWNQNQPEALLRPEQNLILHPPHNHLSSVHPAQPVSRPTGAFTANELTVPKYSVPYIKIINVKHVKCK